MLKHVLILLATSALAQNCPAAIDWRTDEYVIDAQNWKLTRFFANIERIEGLPIRLSERVDGEVSGKFENVPPQNLLSQVCRAFSLTWFFDGSVLFIVNRDEIRSEIIPMPASTVRMTEELLQQHNVDGDNLEFRLADDQQGLAIVRGPSRYFEMIQSFSDQFALRDSVPVVEVFPLKYAWAYDLHFKYQDEDVTVPGIATVLQSITTTGEGTASGLSRRPVDHTEPQSFSSLPKPTTKLLPVHSNSAHTQPTPGSGFSENQTNAQKETGSTTILGKSADPNAQQVLPQIYADVRLNSVVIRDTRDNVTRFGEVIRSLDKPVDIIELRAAIVDISEDSLRELGVDWSGVATTANTSSTTGTTTDLATQFLTGAAGSGSVLLVKNGAALLANIQALQQKGKAKVISQPAVVTLDNVEAIIKSDQTFYVRVKGYQDSNLFNVSAGVKLQVTPHVIADGGRPRIKLVVSISDGDVTDQSVDRIPVVQETNVNTQATILENQSLLLGGYSRDQFSDSRRGIPLLEKLPLLGYIFRHDQKSSKNAQRLFLITPRIVNLAYEPAPNFAKLFAEPSLQDSAGKKRPRRDSKPPTH
jgi:type III secretion protein C